MRKSMCWVTAAFLGSSGLALAQDGGGPTPPEGQARPSFFARFDADKDGKVTLAELQADTKKLIETADKDGDGLLTEEELRDGRAQAQFTAIDADKDGQLTLAEFTAQPQRGGPGMGRGGGRGGRGGRGLMARDEDGDGKYSLDELTAFQRNLFEQADTDQDGELSADEMANAQPMRGRGRRGGGGGGGGEGGPPPQGGEGQPPQGGEGQPPQGEGNRPPQGGEGGERRGRRGGGEGGGWGRGAGVTVKPEDLFAALDKDKSGGLNLEEFKQLAAEREKLVEAQRVY